MLRKASSGVFGSTDQLSRLADGQAAVAIGSAPPSRRQATSTSVSCVAAGHQGGVAQQHNMFSEFVHELQVEAVMHVPAYLAGACAADPRNFPMDLVGRTTDTWDDDFMSVGACLATPPDPVDERGDTISSVFAVDGRCATGRLRASRGSTSRRRASRRRRASF